MTQKAAVTSGTLFKTWRWISLIPVSRPSWSGTVIASQNEGRMSFVRRSRRLGLRPAV